MRLLLGLGVAFGLITTTVLVQQQDAPPLQRIVDLPYTIHVVDYCTVPSVVIGLARKLKVPAGAEFLPGKCYASNRPREMDRELDLLGLTLEDALDRLVAADPRYRWIESEGVILVRPLTSWSDAKNFLNHTVPQFELNEAHMGGALDVIVGVLRGRHSETLRQVYMRSEEANRRLTIRAGPTSVAGALNAVVSAHGGLVWEARGHSKTTFGEQDGTIYLHTFDFTDGIGASTKVRR